MGRREELERELALAQKRIGEAPETIPSEVMAAYNRELDSIVFELDNLYDDQETQTQ
jgi:hypothetical protein